ncbi:hypothetical protein BDB01DRAFT_485364 [Pilobolus umbonatus]|nr:hypothetical protein BDB01DRAFT_485364 [Pilobolus umbonatus]
MCDLSDPRIVETYTAITEGESTNWMMLGYNDTRDVISLYTKGTEGLNEFRNHLVDEVLYGFVRVEDKFILITWVSDQVSGVRRARAFVHSRSVASLLKLNNAQINASNMNDLSDQNIRTKLKLGEGQLSNRKSSSSLSEQRQKRLSRRQSAQSPTSPVATSPIPSSPAPNTPQDEFLEAQETLPSNEEELIQQQREEKRKRIMEKQRMDREREEERQKQMKFRQEQEENRKNAEKEAMMARKLEEERQLKERAEEERVLAEKKKLQQRLLDAEKNKGVLLAGYMSVQPSNSPFWRRRYFKIKGRNLLFYRDEQSVTPVLTLDLNSVTRLNYVNIDIETFVPNAFVLQTQKNGSYQLFADDRKTLDTILTALQTVI